MFEPIGGIFPTPRRWRCVGDSGDLAGIGVDVDEKAEVELEVDVDVDVEVEVEVDGGTEPRQMI